MIILVLELKVRWMMLVSWLYGHVVTNQLRMFMLAGKTFTIPNKSTIEILPYLKGVEMVMQLKKDYENSGSQEYMKLLQMVRTYTDLI